MHLASLPLDIVRIIMGLDAETHSGMRMISPHWNKLILDYRKGLPTISSVAVDVKSGKAELRSINVAEQDVQYFGFSGWPKHIHAADNGENMINLHSALKNVNERTFTKKLFNICIRIEKVELRFFEARNIEYQDLVKAIKFFGDTEIETLHMTEFPNFSLPFQSAILQLIEARSFERLVLHTREAAFAHNLVNNLSTYQPFFCEAVRTVSQIQLKTVYEIAQNSIHQEWNDLELKLNNIEGLKAELAILNDPNFGKVLCISITSKK